MKKNIFITLFFCSVTLFGQEENNTSQNEDIISSFISLSQKQLIDTANYYFRRNSYDTAVVCYNLLINTIPKSAEIEHQKMLQVAYDRLANIHYLVSDYRISFDFLIKSLLICEKYNLKAPETRIYGNIGTIYANLNQKDLGKQYYLKSLELAIDSADIASLLNNLADNELRNNNTESAYYYLNQAINIINNYNNARPKPSIYGTLALYYQKKKQYDSAFYYYRISMEYAKKNNNIMSEAINLSDIGKLFFEINKIDSALYYIDLSNKKASENKFLNIISDNYHILSEIEKSRGRYKNALELYETYTDLKDSILNANVYGSVNLLQRQYEVSKTNQQIEELIIDRQLKENTIRYQKIILLIIITTLLLMGLVLFFIFSQNKKLRNAYNMLVDKNVEIVDLLEKFTDINPVVIHKKRQKVDSRKIQNMDTEISSAENPENTETFNQVSSGNNEKSKNVVLSEQSQNELLSRILNFMENTSDIYNPDFTMDKLSNSISSNNLYVSQVINNVLKTNFRTFLNSYRIREAQRIFSNPDNTMYSVEYVANKVGFMTRKTFDEVFKEKTGVTPSYYAKSLKKKTDLPKI